MNGKRGKNGFTLVEILVAVALIAAILSMVYGSYFATSRSAQVCQARIAMCHQGRTTLDQMAQQIRCAYAGTMANDADSGESGTQQTRTVPEGSVRFFNGSPNAPNGEILRLVTTNGFDEEKGPTDGLFEITYRFDKSTGVLSLSQGRFIGTAQKAEARNWRPIAENIECLELTFFDGRKWQRSWDFKDKEKLPYAVRIEISYEDDDYKRYEYGTVAYISCRRNRTGTDTETLVSVNKQ
jgi:type II secretion system protein J